MAPAEQLQLRLGVEQVGVVVATRAERIGELAQRHALAQHAERLPGHELRHPELVEVAERVLVVRQQVLGRELQQDRVVALEGREHVRVGLQRREAAGAQIARAAAGLAAALDRVRRVPGRDRLHARGERLQLAPLTLRRVLVREHGVQVLDEPVLRERQRVRLGQRDQQPPLVRAVVHQQRFLLGAGGAELAPLERAADRDRQRHLRRADRRAADADAALDERPEHREEAPRRVLDRAEVGAVLVHLRELVEQVLARDTHLVEPQAAVVDAVEARASRRSPRSARRRTARRARRGSARAARARRAPPRP